MNAARAFGGPNIGVSAEDGSALASRTSRQWEEGLKGQWPGKRLSASLVYFDLRQQNIAQPLSPVPGSPSALSGEARSRGLEIDAQGRIAEGVDVIATYTRMSAKYTDDVEHQGTACPTRPSTWAACGFKRVSIAGVFAGQAWVPGCSPWTTASATDRTRS